MKTALLTAAAAFLLTVVSEGAQARSPAAQQPWTCTGLERVAARPSDPVRCCEGQIRCAQFLSTTTILRARRDQRT